MLDQCKAACSARPNDYALHVNWSNLLKQSGHVAGARALLERAVQVEPARYEAWYNLGILLFETWWLDESIDAFERALQGFPPGSDDARLQSVVLSTALALQRAGEWKKATQFLEHWAAELPAMASDCRRVALLGSVVDPDASPAASLAAHRAWAQVHADPKAPARPGYTNIPAAQRPLRVGYVSGDLCSHAVSLFFEPVLACHDRGAFELFCYDNSPREDSTTVRLRRHRAVWRAIAGIADDECRRLIQADRIDVLVDLSGHTAHNRLDLFALKPAPVQVTWLGYRTTTGMAAMDWRVTDGVVDPPGASDGWYSERLMRLSCSQWCFAEPESSVEPGLLPMLASGHVTFGSFNQFDKLNERAIRIWARILSALPASRLVIAGVPLGSRRAKFLGLWQRHGIQAGRLELHSYVSRAEFHALHRRVDVALDTFPCNGGTTTCESLWMGVPVVTLAGQWGIARAGSSLLHAARLADWVADNESAYAEIAIERARDVDALARLRASLRAQLRGSPLMDGARFTRALEDGVRAAWREWCDRASFVS